MTPKFIELTENCRQPRRRLFNLGNVSSIVPWLEYKSWGQEQKELGTMLVTVSGETYYVNEKYDEVKEIIEKMY